MEDKFGLYYGAQTWFVKNPEIFSCSRQRALEIIGRKICEVMSIQRLGVWMFNSSRDTLTEELTYSLSGSLIQGSVLFRKDIPSYFEQIDQQRVISVSSSEFEKPLHKFVESYMLPLNIISLLDAPIFFDGICIGVLCCEVTTGSRVWDEHDTHFASTCADFIGRIIESEKRHSYEKALSNQIATLEIDLKNRLITLDETKLSLDLALESAQAGKWDWEISSGKINCNKTWFTRLGYTEDELPHDLSAFKKVLHPDDVQKAFDAIDKHLKGDASIYECRYRMITKSGVVQYCFDRGRISKRAPDGTPLQMTGVNIDITPVIQLEQSLLNSQKKLEAMIRSLPTPVAMLDKNLSYLAFSQRWQEEWSALGKIRAGKSIAEHIGENKNKDVWIDQMKLALLGESFSREEELIQLNSSTQIWLRWIIQPWKDALDEIGGLIIMAENISERKETQARLAQNSKLSALGEMAGGIAHEINNPLSIIKGYIDLFKRHASRETLTNELLIQYIDKMDSTVGRISKIVNGMRRFSRESSFDDKSPYSLNKIIDETLDICLERIINNGTALTVDYFKNEPMVFCRSVEISQVLLNLINNSFQAISTLSRPWIKIVCVEHEKSFEMKIIDSGSGISKSIVNKLFQPFFTTKDIGIGTGLGLSISRGIIEDHQGSLQYVEDSTNTTFSIQLPKWRKEDN
jgi:signal transduction histidine kinase/GAF domain-containing protein